jgi:hypothetical protein
VGDFLQVVRIHAERVTAKMVYYELRVAPVPQIESVAVGALLLTVNAKHAIVA